MGLVDSNKFFCFYNNKSPLHSRSGEIVGTGLLCWPPITVALFSKRVRRLELFTTRCEAEPSCCAVFLFDIAVCAVCHTRGFADDKERKNTAREKGKPQQNSLYSSLSRLPSILGQWFDYGFGRALDMCRLVVEARNRTYSIPILCSVSIPEPIAELTSGIGIGSGITCLWNWPLSAVCGQWFASALQRVSSTNWWTRMLQLQFSPGKRVEVAQVGKWTQCCEDYFLNNQTRNQLKYDTRLFVCFWEIGSEIRPKHTPKYLDRSVLQQKGSSVGLIIDGGGHCNFP